MVGAAALDPAPLAASSYSAAFLVENLWPGAGELGGTEYSVQEEHSEEGGSTRLTLTDPHRCEDCNQPNIFLVASSQKCDNKVQLPGGRHGVQRDRWEHVTRDT